MQVIYYADDAELRRILATRVDASAAAVVIVPCGMAWLLPKQAGAPQKLTEVV